MSSSSSTPDEVVKDHIIKLRIKELTECLDRLGMKKQGRKEDLQRRLLTIIDDAGSLCMAGQQPRGMPQVEATKRVVEEVYARLMVEKATPSLRAHATRTDASSANPAAANGGAHPPSRPTPPSTSSLHWPGSNTAARPPQPNTIKFPAQQPPSRAGSTFPSHPSHACTSAAGVAAAGQPSSASGGALRCICDQPTARHGELLACTACGVYQHARCVTRQEARAAAPPHMCEKCRAARIDPYWEVVTSDIMPAFKLVPSGKSVYVGTKLEPVQTAERTFTITPQQYELFKKRPNHKLQVACMQLSDPVPFRCLWPLASDLRINNLQMHVYSRGAHTKPGKNQRDEPANIGVLCQPSRNRITMTCSDPASYMLLLQIVRRRSIEEVKALTKPPLPLHEAIERVKREIKSSDEDIEVDHAVVSLKCPLTGGRVKTPARFSEVEGLTFFDLDAFLLVAERSRKWQCPNSLRNSSVHTLQVDSFMSCILASLKDLPDVAEVQVSPQGQWRPVGGPGAKGSGSSWPWLDVGTAPSALPLPGQLADQEQGKQQQQQAGAAAVKQEPVDGASSDEEDADTELRKVAQAIQAQQQRKAKQPELIVISDSSDDEVPPPPKRSRPSAAAAAAAAAAGAVPPPPPPAVSAPPAPGPIRVRVRPPASHVASNPPFVPSPPAPQHPHTPPYPLVPQPPAHAGFNPVLVPQPPPFVPQPPLPTQPPPASAPPASLTLFPAAQAAGAGMPGATLHPAAALQHAMGLGPCGVGSGGGRDGGSGTAGTCKPSTDADSLRLHHHHHHHHHHHQQRQQQRQHLEQQLQELRQQLEQRQQQPQQPQAHLPHAPPLPPQSLPFSSTTPQAAFQPFPMHGVQLPLYPTLAQSYPLAYHLPAHANTQPAHLPAHANTAPGAPQLAPGLAQPLLLHTSQAMPVAAPAWRAGSSSISSSCMAAAASGTPQATHAEATGCGVAGGVHRSSRGATPGGPLAPPPPSLHSSLLATTAAPSPTAHSHSTAQQAQQMRPRPSRAPQAEVIVIDDDSDDD